MTRDEKAWWQTVDAHPGDLLVLGQLADWLQEQMHPWGTAMRYAYERQLVPQPMNEGFPVVYWVWHPFWQNWPYGVMGSKMPSWLKPRGGWRWYKSCSSAYQSYCKRFAYWEEHYPLKFAKLVLK